MSYGSVVVITLLAIWTYVHFAKARENPEDSTMIAIGSVWLPVYPGAVTEKTTSAEHDHATESTFSFRSQDPAAKVLAFYAPKLRTAHFQSYLSQRNDTGGMLQAGVSGHNSTVVITAHPANSGSEVIITTLDR